MKLPAALVKKCEALATPTTVRVATLDRVVLAPPPSTNGLFVEGVNRKTGRAMRVKTKEYSQTNRGLVSEFNQRAPRGHSRKSSVNHLSSHEGADPNRNHSLRRLRGRGCKKKHSAFVLRAVLGCS